MTTRRWMIAVAVVAVVLGGIVSPFRVYRTRQRYQSLAINHALAEKAWHLANESDPDVLKMIDYHARLKAKYERAAARPWLAVEPDPPVPYQGIRWASLGFIGPVSMAGRSEHAQQDLDRCDSLG
jgi:hypothetical protein